MLEPSDYMLLATIAASLWGTLYSTARSQAESLRRLERKVDLILRSQDLVYIDHVGPQGLSQEARSLADDPAKKILAIKLLREQSGMSLKAAKETVDRYIERKAGGAD